jgi:hypothetical protein
VAHRGEVSNKISHRSRQFKYKKKTDLGCDLKKHFRDTRSVRVLVMEFQIMFKNSMMDQDIVFS